MAERSTNAVVSSPLQNTDDTLQLPNLVGLFGTGEMARRIQAFPWSDHQLGPLSGWPETLVATVNLMLACPVPMQLFWGEDMMVLYNDAAIPVLAGKHPVVLGRPARECWAEAWHTIGPQLEGVRATGVPLNFRALLVPITRNGILEDAWWDYSYSAVATPDGRVGGVLDIFSEVTAAVLAQRQKQESDERLQLALEGAELGMWSYDPVTTEVVADQRMHRIFGSPDPEGSVNYWMDMLHPEDRDRVGRHFDGAVAGKHPYDIEYRIVRPDGLRWVRSKGRFVDFPGKPPRLAAILEDITDRKEIEGVLASRERQLRVSENAATRSEEQLQTITDALPSYIAYVDPKLRYRRVNRTYEQWFRLVPSQIVGKTVYEVLGPDAAAHVAPQLMEALQGKRKDFEYKLTIFGEERFLSVAHIPDFDHDGSVRGVIVQGQDITELKRSEQALLQTEKLAAVGRLAASIAHEINNPLEAVTNLLFLARGSEDVPQIQEYLDGAERELRRVSVITNQTLRFYKQSTRPRAVTCHELLESVLSIYAGRLLNSGVTVDQTRCQHQTVECFEGEIRQVISNLVGNAIDAMHPHGGRLILRSRRATDWQTGRTGVVLTIADTGTGMSPTVRRSIFQAFYTTKDIGGTGLGLWVSKEIIERHHGRISVRSSQRPGRSGTVFTLFLPAEAVSR